MFTPLVTFLNFIFKDLHILRSGLELENGHLEQFQKLLILVLAAEALQYDIMGSEK